MTTNQLQVGIIGAGRIGKVHAETLAFFNHAQVLNARIQAGIFDSDRRLMQCVGAGVVRTGKPDLQMADPGRLHAGSGRLSKKARV